VAPIYAASQTSSPPRQVNQKGGHAQDESSRWVNVDTAEFEGVSGGPMDLQLLELAAMRQIYEAMRSTTEYGDRKVHSIENDREDDYLNTLCKNAGLVQFSCPEHDLKEFFVSTAVKVAEETGRLMDDVTEGSGTNEETASGPAGHATDSDQMNSSRQLDPEPLESYYYTVSSVNESC
jgi:hypothetical protein